MSFSPPPAGGKKDGEDAEKKKIEEGGGEEAPPVVQKKKPLPKALLARLQKQGIIKEGGKMGRAWSTTITHTITIQS